jgi:plastocyanin
MKKILIAIAVFLAAGTGSYFYIQEKGGLFEDPRIAAVSQTIIQHYGVYVYFVSYEDSGFNPKDFKIPVGNSARFINNSNKAMRIYSKSQETPYHFLNQSFSVGKGGIYNFNFTLKGLWEFYNLNNPSDKGSITVY